MLIVADPASCQHCFVISALTADAQPELSMDDAFVDMLGDVDDILFDFAASSVDPDDSLLGPPGSSSNGVAPLHMPSATAVDDLQRSSPSINDTPSPSSTAAPDAAADSRIKRKAEQNRCSDPWSVSGAGSASMRRLPVPALMRPTCLL